MSMVMFNDLIWDIRNPLETAKTKILEVQITVPEEVWEVLQETEFPTSGNTLTIHYPRLEMEDGEVAEMYYDEVQYDGSENATRFDVLKLIEEYYSDLGGEEAENIRPFFAGMVHDYQHDEAGEWTVELRA